MHIIFDSCIFFEITLIPAAPYAILHKPCIIGFSRQYLSYNRILTSIKLEKFFEKKENICDITSELDQNGKEQIHIL